MRKLYMLLALLLAVSLLPAAGFAAGAGTVAEDEIRTVLELFSIFRGTEMIAASGAGAWEGRLRIGTDGSFTGSYYDADDMNIYQVDFSGQFGEIYRKDTGEYKLVVYSAATEETPGTTVRGDYGEIIHYTDTIMPRGSVWTLTVPGVDEDRIPETVKGEIGGTWDEWEDYSGIVTLTDKDGWGFFMEDTRATSEWNKNLFRQKSSVYNNDLALAAAHLSLEAEGETEDRIRRQFNKYDIGEHDFRNYDRRVYSIIDDWANFFAANNAYAIGQCQFTYQDSGDVTVLVLVARGTMKPLGPEGFNDFTHNLDIHEELGHSVWTNVWDFEEEIWKELEVYLEDHPIRTDKVKILVTGHSLGGAAANLLGAKLSKKAGSISGLKGKVTQDDVYVYTFGAIRVLPLTEDNVSSGYENIHNIYNLYDDFAPNGNKAGLYVGTPGAKFGHTDMYSRKDEKNSTHIMESYIFDLTYNHVGCSLPGAPSPDTPQQELGEKDYIRDGRDYTPIWFHNWKGVTIPGSTISVDYSYYEKDELTVAINLPGYRNVFNTKAYDNQTLAFGSEKDDYTGALTFSPKDGGTMEVILYNNTLTPDDPRYAYMSLTDPDKPPLNILVYKTEDNMEDLFDLYEWSFYNTGEESGDDWQRTVTPEEWIGTRASPDDSNAEMIITDNGDGTLHMTVVFFRNMQFDADLYTGTSALIWFETEYDELEGTVELKTDGSVVFSPQGGEALDPELEFGDFFALNTFVFSPADPDSLWFYNPSDIPGETGDWVGEWEMAGGDYESRLVITPNGQGGLHGVISFDSAYYFEADLEVIDSENLDFLTDDFGGMLTLNRKQQKVRLTECFAVDEYVNEWLDFFHYMVEYGLPGTSGA